MKFLFLFLLPCIIKADVLINNPVGLVRKTFKIKDICQHLGVKESLLAEAAGVAKIDCMGKEFSVGYFCKNSLKLKNFTRGFVLSDKEVVCESAESVHLSVSLVGKNSHYLKNKYQSCQKLGKIFANTLALQHASLLGSSPFGPPSQISCLFTSKRGPILK